MIGNQLHEIEVQLEGLDEVRSLLLLSQLFAGKVVFSTSFGLEDQVITDLIFSNHIDINVFTLDTGRMFPETYYTWNQTNERYHTKVKAYYPQQETLETYILNNGPNAFYESIDLRKQCCFIRKVEPLTRALKGNKVWITGMRAEQSPDRKDLPILEWDETNHILKYHPLLYWSFDKVKQYINSNNVPYNPLHDKGYVSIGCQPCTRAIREGEDFRAGRWWWEDSSKKECGLHIHAVEQN
ncbi:MAG: phosphoadenylyl-sulfate reductase [Pseudopedobacter saltans]|uniref:Adenosine 5'-phosphosulfate reductase n=1 Tax=Pseudopedobacter saltans TaxID=151895 RepID=A0A2W5EZ98_9SPHI|nr:MAG: phosphoadenylyl-sulfate reductase [Pseudopedobacter saltans]